MANVFNVPGVPSLGSYLAGGFSLLSGDVSLGAAVAQASLQWGIFLNGNPIVLPANPLSPLLAPLSVISSLVGVNIFPVTASFVDVEFKQDWAVSDYPVEEGGFQTYDKVQLPFAFRVRLAVSGDPATLQGFLATIQSIGDDVDGLYEVVTPSAIYTSCTVEHIDYHRSAERGVSMLLVDVWFKEIRETATANLFDNSNAANPAFASTQNAGISQPQVPTLSQSTLITGTGLF